MKFYVPISLSLYLFLVFLFIALVTRAFFYLLVGVLVIVAFWALFLAPRKIIIFPLMIYAFKDWKTALSILSICLITWLIVDYFKSK